MLTERRWNLDLVLLLVAGLLISQSLGGSLIWWLNQSGASDPNGRLLRLAISAAAFQGMALLLYGPFIRAHETGWKPMLGLDSPRRARAVWFGLGTGFALVPIGIGLNWVCTWLLTSNQLEPVSQEQIQLLQQSHGFSARLLIGFTSVCLAPLAEEILFRGILYPAVKELGYPRLALWGVSLLFAVIHQNLVIVVPLMVLALILTWLYESTDCLLAPVIAHAVFNLANFALAL